jgi:hypothetical protein
MNTFRAWRHQIMGPRRETLAFCGFLAICIAAFFHETLFGGKVLSPADVLLVSASFRGESAEDYQPANRLLMDPVLQFQPWLEFNRRMIRTGRLPLWNGHAGCGVPHLANGQSAVFDPFHLLAYLGPTPDVYTWIASCRLWIAGLGMFLLARAWGLGPYGRWFAGLVYPFSGFLIVWLLYPVTSVAIWLPWLVLATDRVTDAPNSKTAGWLALVVALVILGGHIQTSAHVILLGGLYASLRCWWAWRANVDIRRVLVAWGAGIALGLGLAAVQILPLGCYLAKSSVWADRKKERPAWWAIARPRLLETVCTAAPYVYGSQRRGYPNVARAIGAHNLNESAGGFAGLASLIWLAPLGIAAGGRTPRTIFLAGVVVFGALGAFQFPPVDNVLRALPVLDVTDNRRLTLWVAFGLTLLGGIGLDQLGESHRLARVWLGLWVLAASVLGAAAFAIPSLERPLRERARAHYHAAALSTPGALFSEYHERGERQVAQTLQFLPRYYGFVAGQLLVLAALAVAVRKARSTAVWVQPTLLGLTLAELALFGFGLNPAIEASIHTFEPQVVTRLRRELRPEDRALGVGEELPPNTLMRYGLSDPRNYDSIEIARSLSWLVALYKPGESTFTSRSEVDWNGVARVRDRLRESGVRAIVASTPPPTGDFTRTERVGRVWIAWLEAKPWADSTVPEARIAYTKNDGKAEVAIDSPARAEVVVRETWDPGWRARIDGKPAILRPKWGVFLSIDVEKGCHIILLEYDPIEIRFGLAVSIGSAVLLILVLTGICKL